MKRYLVSVVVVGGLLLIAASPRIVARVAKARPLAGTIQRASASQPGRKASTKALRRTDASKTLAKKSKRASTSGSPARNTADGKSAASKATKRVANKKKVSKDGATKGKAPQAKLTKAGTRKARAGKTVARKRKTQRSRFLAARSRVKTATKRTGRLPRFYSQLGLDEAQKTRILKVEAAYRARSRKLKDQLKTLRADHEQQLAGTLKPAQRKQLKTLLAGKRAGKAKTTGRKKLARKSRRGPSAARAAKS